MRPTGCRQLWRRLRECPGRVGCCYCHHRLNPAAGVPADAAGASRRPASRAAPGRGPVPERSASRRLQACPASMWVGDTIVWNVSQAGRKAASAARCLPNALPYRPRAPCGGKRQQCSSPWTSRLSGVQHLRAPPSRTAGVARGPGGPLLAHGACTRRGAAGPAVYSHGP